MHSCVSTCIQVGFECGSVGILEADTLHELVPPTLASPAKSSPHHETSHAATHGGKPRAWSAKGPKLPLKTGEGTGGSPQKKEAVEQIVFLEDGGAVAVQRGARWAMHDALLLHQSVPLTSDPGANDECALSLAHGAACFSGTRIYSRTPSYGTLCTPQTWWYSTILSHAATHCHMLKHTAKHCNVLQNTATHCKTSQHTVTLALTCCCTQAGN